VPGNQSSSAARVAWICAAAAVVFVLWIVTDVSANAGIGFFYTVPIGMAAWWGGRRWAAVTVAGCAFLYLLGALVQPISNVGVAFAVRLLSFGAVGILVTALRERLLVLEHSAEELEAIRAALTPATLPELAGVDAAATFVPSEYGVSGDFYLLTNGPDGSIVAVVGDVVGHGPKAARLATFIRARFAALAANTSDPAELLSLANDAIADRRSRGRELVSAVCIRYQPDRGRLSWAAAGHPAPLRLPDVAEMKTVGTTFLLGAEAELELGTAETSLEEGDGVVIYTDGATDVRRGGTLLGLGGLTGMLQPIAHFPAKNMVRRVEQGILEWAEDPVRDDLCLLVLKPS
jgi:serine phosphatase RsbU (regulator of sigma subunit)